VVADGEEVAMFAVEVHDAQGRVVPITDNDVAFRITGAGKLIGVGNGDPTDHGPDKGTSRKAFSGLCMALIQSTKAPGEITVEATSPGLTAATVTIAAKETKLRPQVAVWKREIPKGSGVTGVWRPVKAKPSDSQLLEMLTSGDNVFVLQQAERFREPLRDLAEVGLAATMCPLRLWEERWMVPGSNSRLATTAIRAR
jgi:beta-galactosidase